MATPPALVGRSDEARALDDLVRGAIGGTGGALVLRGEAGIGKSALLDRLRGAQGVRVLEASGSELESELPFAALHQLCRPLAAELAGLPAVHRDALEAAFGLAAGGHAPFRVGVALLELLAAAAGSGPVLCLVDDGQWLDDATRRAIVFLGRRLAAEPVALVLATRAGLDELPALAVTGLSDDDARTVLARRRATLDATVRDRVVAEARGNPLALLELPGAGGFAPPDTASVPARIERTFADRLPGLPDDARLLLTLASADPTGDPALLWRAAARLGIDTAAAGSAEASGLVEIAARVRFCHPLARSVVYRAAPAADRGAAHRALAEVTDAADADRRAWHRGQTGTGPDEDLAAELEAAASRARARGGVAAAAAFLERAAGLSLDADRRVDRTLTAAGTHLEAGATGAADALLTALDDASLGEEAAARAELLRGRVASVRDGGDEGPVHMLRAAHRLADRDPRWSRDRYLDAVETALVVGRAGGVMDMVVEAARSAPTVPGPPDLLDALVLLTTDGHAAAAGPVRSILALGPPWAGRPALVGMLAVEFWDVAAHADITRWLLDTGRPSGEALTLLLGLGMAATAAVHVGDLAAATAGIAEAEAVADAVGAPPLPYPRLHLAGMRGRPAELRAATAALPATARSGQTVANVHWATAVQANAAGEPAVALPEALAAARHGDLFVAGIAQFEVVEAAVRTGDDAAAAAALADLTVRTTAAATPWARGVGACARALVTGSEDDYRAAVDALADAAPYRARAQLLHGEWLRRQGRRRDARDQLRAAHEAFVAIGMEAFAERAAGELRATGERARSRSADDVEALTLQEQHIAGLVAGGATSKEVAARLYISPRTVDAHLRNIFGKLGISSRRQLRDVPGVG